MFIAKPEVIWPVHGGALAEHVSGEQERQRMAKALVNSPLLGTGFPTDLI